MLTDALNVKRRASHVINEKLGNRFASQQEQLEKHFAQQEQLEKRLAQQEAHLVNQEPQPTYNADGIRVWGRNTAFLRETRFVESYARGMDSGHKIGRASGSSEDIHIEWRVETSPITPQRPPGAEHGRSDAPGARRPGVRRPGVPDEARLAGVARAEGRARKAALEVEGSDPTIRLAEDIAERLGEVPGVAAAAATPSAASSSALARLTCRCGAACGAANPSNATR